jgi:arsenate reductase
MSRVTIYHNPKCSKSRQTLELLEERAIDPAIVLYLENPPTETELKETLGKLGTSARGLIRNGEPVYKDLGLDDEKLSEDALIKAMVNNPILIERPVVITKNRAKIGRPPESILEILDR